MLRTWYPGADDRTPAENLAANGLDPATFERLLHRIAKAMPSLDQPMSIWVPAAAAVLGQHPPAEGAVRTMKRLSLPGACGPHRARHRWTAVGGRKWRQAAAEHRPPGQG